VQRAVVIGTNRVLEQAGLWLLVGALGGLQTAMPAPSASAAGEHWVATWTMSPMPADALPDGENKGLTNQTLREVAHVSIGGRRLRLRVSNAYGSAPLTVGAAHVALHAQGPSIVPGSDHRLTFHGGASVVIPPGALMLSDAIDWDVAPLSDLAVSIFLPDATGPLTWHQLGTQTTYLSTPGDVTAAADFPVAATSTSLFVLAGIDVRAPRTTGSIVALGDSITDGYASTKDAFRRWPDQLSQRLNQGAAGPTLAVLNQGISGNRLLHDVIGPNALARFDRDVLAQPGVTQVVVLEGINDIGLPGAFNRPGEAVSSDDLCGALTQLIARAHGQGLRIYGATLTPFEGSGEPYYSADGEAKRQALNDWIRTRAPFDGVLDFDRVLRDPDHPTRMQPAYDSGDHLHPNDAGYQAMAASVDLRLLDLRRRHARSLRYRAGPDLKGTAPALDATSAPSEWRHRGGWSRHSASGSRRWTAPAARIPPVGRDAAGRGPGHPASPAPLATGRRAWAS
jgi:lysophospholipase L1-like esterase